MGRTLALVCGAEVSRTLFLGICLNFHYFLSRAVLPKTLIQSQRIMTIAWSAILLRETVPAVTPQ